MLKRLIILISDKMAKLTISNEYAGPITEITFGYLYNWYVASDPRLVANTGWRVPTYSDFNTLATYAGGFSVAGDKLKDTAYWLTATGTNDYGFTARPTGQRSSVDGSFVNQFLRDYSWTSESLNEFTGRSLILVDNTVSASVSNVSRGSGNNIRLVKESTSLSHGQTGIYICNDGTALNTICIGTQEWLQDNLKETQYRNGDPIPVVTDGTAWAALTTGARCVYDNDEDNA